MSETGTIESTSRTGRAPSLPLYLVLLRPLRTLLFALAFLLLELVCLVYQVVVIALPCALSRRYRRLYYHALWNWIISFWGRNTCRLARWTTGMRVEVEGRIPEGRFLVVANHQSAADIFMLFELLGDKNLKFVVKKELLRWLPVVSYALRNGGFGVVDFSNRQKTLEDMRGYAHSLAAWDGSPLIFPEGIRSFDGTMSRFRSAGLRLLVRETGLPVLPVVIDGLWPARSTFKFFLHLPGARCRVSVLAPLEVSPGGDSGELTGKVEARIRDELLRMRGGDPPGDEDRR